MQKFNLQSFANQCIKNFGKTKLLDRKAQFLPTSMTGVDAQLLETRRYQIEEICQPYSVYFIGAVLSV